MSRGEVSPLNSNIPKYHGCVLKQRSDAHHHGRGELPPVAPGAQDEGDQHSDAAHELEETAQLTSHVRGGNLHYVDGRRCQDESQSSSTEEPASMEYRSQQICVVFRKKYQLRCNHNRF